MNDDERVKYKVNQDPKHLLDQIQNFALDMDGTIYLDTTWIPGAMEFLKKIKETGRHYCFMTNNSSKNPQVYVDKLAKMGLQIDEKTELATSGEATAEYLQAHYPGKKVYLFGNKVLKDEFREAGITLVEDDPDLVVTAFDTEFDYQDLIKLCDFVRSGLPYIGTHPDFNCPTKTGFVPDIGSLHAYIEASTGRKPDKIIGKPNKEIIDYTMKVMGGKPANTVVVGDRLYTDIKSGVVNGLPSILVLSGESQLKDLPTSDAKPDLIFDSIKDITKLL